MKWQGLSIHPERLGKRKHFSKLQCRDDIRTNLDQSSVWNSADWVKTEDHHQRWGIGRACCPGEGTWGDEDSFLVTKVSHDLPTDPSTFERLNAPRHGFFWCQAFNLSFLMQREEDVLLPPLTCLEASQKTCGWSFATQVFFKIEETIWGFP